MTRTTDPRRTLPSIAALLEMTSLAAWAADAPRAALTDAARAVVAAVRAGEEDSPADAAGWQRLIERHLRATLRPTLRPVLNATGIVLHTNLGRAPLADAALAAIQATAAGYATLEYDLTSGARGTRESHCVELLRELTGAEDALVVNNCAAALVLALNTLAAGREVLVSRGELVEIGGSFRIPDIMARSSARLVEVGTTNRTHLLDYRAAITPGTAAIVKVHRSNFSLSGFTAEATLPELAALGAERQLPTVFDLGSGLLIPLISYGFPDEPTAARAVADGASLVLMSGDKLLGGPQAGIIVGRRELVARLKANPLARALRVDKLTIAALGATLALYRDPVAAVRSIPTLAMLCAPVERVRRRAAELARQLSAAGHRAEVADSAGAVGAGAFPTFALPSAAVALAADDANALESRLRGGDPPVIGRIAEGRVLLDLRTVPERDDAELARAVLAALAA